MDRFFIIAIAAWMGGPVALMLAALIYRKVPAPKSIHRLTLGLGGLGAGGVFLIAVGHNVATAIPVAMFFFAFALASSAWQSFLTRKVDNLVAGITASHPELRDRLERNWVLRLIQKLRI